ncbi:MAG: NERD domain-containing protein [Ignavibacteriales bacterium]|nr:NERD domain-containing protein [Ignavibacteriales bacterium]
MPFNIYKGGSNITEGERDILSSLAKILDNQYKDSSEFCYLFVGLYCERQIDAILIKKDGIINIELKNYKVQQLQVTDTGDVIILPHKKRLHEGRSETPFAQVQDQNYKIKNRIFKKQEKLFGAEILSSSDDIDVCGFLVIGDIGADMLPRIPRRYYPFFRIVDTKRYMTEMVQYKGRDPVKKHELPLNLDENFAKCFAEELNLTPITNFDSIVNDQLQWLKDTITKHAGNIIQQFKEPNYIHRPEIENQLLNSDRCVLSGSPGSGKTSMVRAIIYNESKMIALKSFEYSRIPIFISLRGYEDIISVVANILKETDESKIKYLLQNGKCWIFFDGLDEMTDFAINYKQVIDFIESFPTNRYVLSIRKEIFHNLLLKGDQKKNKDNDYDVVTLGNFGEESALKLFRSEFGENYKEEITTEFLKFLPQLPNRTPLTIRMTAEIFKNSEKPIFENIGKYYNRYFQLRLKREIDKSRQLESFTNDRMKWVIRTLFETVLTNFGKYLFERKSFSIPIYDAYSIISDFIYDEPLKFFDYLLHTDIIRINEERVGFAHPSFRDFYVAKHLIGKLDNDEVLDKIFEVNKEYNSLILYCGIEPDRNIVDKLLLKALEKDRIKLAAECLCNTDNISASTISKVQELLVFYSKKNNHWKCKFENFDMRTILGLIEQYGPRICGADLYHSIEEEIKNDIITKIDWEVLKSRKLEAGEIPDLYKFTYRCAAYISEHKTFPLTSNGLLANYPIAQNKNGYDLYYREAGIKQLNDLIDILTDECLDIELKASLFNEALSANRFPEKGIVRALHDRNALIGDFGEPWMWIVASLYDPDEDILQKLLDHFWKEPSSTVQLRILYYQHNHDLLKKVMTNYRSEKLVDLNAIDRLIDFHIAGMGDMFFCYEENIGENNDTGEERTVKGFGLWEFENETYEVLMRCVAMHWADPREGDMNNIIRNFLKSENAKERIIAEWALKDIK